jgi:hypothetical protein
MRAVLSILLQCKTLYVIVEVFIILLIWKRNIFQQGLGEVRLYSSPTITVTNCGDHQAKRRKQEGKKPKSEEQEGMPQRQHCPP